MLKDSLLYKSKDNNYTGNDYSSDHTDQRSGYRKANRVGKTKS